MSFSLSGIASGMDTQTIIRQLMDLERIPYTKLEQKQSTYNSQMSTFRSINTKLSALRTAADELRLSADFFQRSAVNSDESVLTATVSEGAAETSYDIQVTQLATRHTLKSTASNELSLSGDIVISGNGNQLTFTVDGDVSANENLDKLAQAVNQADLGLKASVIETSPGIKTITFTSDKTGYDNQIATGAATGDVHIDDSGMLGLTTATAGRDAKLTINGVYIKASSNELNNVIPGLSLSLAKVGETNVSISQDAEKMADKVDAFVNAYNDVISTIRANTAKGARLQGDLTLRSLQDHLADIFNSSVGESGDTYQYMFQIGLEIDKGVLSGSAMTGTISFDRDKFKEALATDADAVFRMFAHAGSETAEKGIAEKFSETLRVWTRAGSGILAARINGFDEQISFVRDQMESLEMRLTMREEQLKKQFSWMETSLMTMQGQMNWLSSQIAALSMSN